MVQGDGEYLLKICRPDIRNYSSLLRDILCLCSERFLEYLAFAKGDSKNLIFKIGQLLLLIISTVTVSDSIRGWYC